MFTLPRGTIFRVIFGTDTSLPHHQGYGTIETTQYQKVTINSIFPVCQAYNHRMKLLTHRTEQNRKESPSSIIKLTTTMYKTILKED